MRSSGFLSALAAHDHYSVAVGCLWGCSRAEDRVDEAGRDEAVAIDLPEGSIVDRKSRQFKRTPGVSFSARFAKERERQPRERKGIGARLTSDRQLCCYEMFTTRLLSAASCASGGASNLTCAINFIRAKGPARPPAACHLWRKIMSHACDRTRILPFRVDKD